MSDFDQLVVARSAQADSAAVRAPRGQLPQGRRLPGRPRRLLRPARRAAVRRRRDQRAAADPGLASTAVVIAYDDSDGWYDHAFSGVTTRHSRVADALTGPGACGAGPPLAGQQGRCGYGPAAAAAGRLAVGQAQRSRPHPDRPVLDHTFHRGQLASPANLRQAPTPPPAPLTACSTSANPTAKAAATLRPTNRSCLIRNPDASRLAEGTTFGRTTSTTSRHRPAVAAPGLRPPVLVVRPPANELHGTGAHPLIGTGRAEVRERPCRRQQRSSDR